MRKTLKKERIVKESLLNFKQSAICKDASSGMLAHSVLLISPDDYALQNYAKFLAQTLMCSGENKPCGECAECRKIEHNNHVDIMYYPKANKALNSSEIAELVDLAFQAPYASDKKVFIINNTNNIDASMQNKLLKTLEEPPHNTFFILLATEDNNILPTIKSRCRSVFLPKTSQNEISAILNEQNIAQDVQQQVLAFCGGNCSLALKYAQSTEFYDCVLLVQEILKNFRKSSQMIDYSAKLYKLNDNFEEFLTIFLQNCSDAVKLLCGVKNDNPTALVVAKEFSINAITNLVLECNKFLEKRKRNCNFSALIDSFLFMILEVRHKWPI